MDKAGLQPQYKIKRLWKYSKSLMKETKKIYSFASFFTFGIVDLAL